jgi:hypothetical protein
MESGAAAFCARTVHVSRIIGCLPSAPALNDNADCVPDRMQHSIRILPYDGGQKLYRPCAENCRSIAGNSRINPYPLGTVCQIKRLDEENGESQTACHLLILKARYVCLFHHKEDYASQDKAGKL